jgi:hypothetical protein
MKRYRRADYSGTENDCVSTGHSHLQKLSSYIWIAGPGGAIKQRYGPRPEFPQMKLIGALAAALALCGRHGTLIAAGSIFVGLAVPPLAAAFRPHLGEAIVLMLTLAVIGHSLA